MNKNIWGRIGSIGLLFILNRETEKTSLVDGGPYKSHLRLSCKASGLQRRRALKQTCESSEFHHIIERPLSFYKYIKVQTSISCQTVTLTETTWK